MAWYLIKYREKCTLSFTFTSANNQKLWNNVKGEGSAVPGPQASAGYIWFQAPHIYFKNEGVMLRYNCVGQGPNS
jgi:hypothetical protein